MAYPNIYTVATATATATVSASVCQEFCVNNFTTIIIISTTPPQQKQQQHPSQQYQQQLLLLLLHLRVDNSVTIIPRQTRKYRLKTQQPAWNM